MAIFSFTPADLNQYEIWAVIALVSLFIIFSIYYVEILLNKRLCSLLEKSKYHWTLAIIWALHKPLGSIIWLWGLTFALLFAKTKAIHPEIFFWVIPLRDCGTIILATWFLLRLTKKIESRIFDLRYSQVSIVDITTAHACAQITQVIVIIIAALSLLKYFYNISFTGLWAIGGAGSIIVGLAAKDVLANFFGAVMIYFDRPFSIGDSIRSPDREIEGSVESIGWRLTCIRTADKSPLYIPNSVFATMCIENTSHMTSRHMEETIKIRYQDNEKIIGIIGDIKGMLLAHPDVDNSKSIIVNLVTFGTASLDILVSCCTNTIERTAYQNIKQNILLQILQIVHTNHAEFAIPTHNLTLPQNAALRWDMLKKENQ